MQERSEQVHEELEETSPEMIVPGGTPTSQDALDAALATGPVMAGDWWDLEVERVEPTFLPVKGGRPLLYRGMSHAFIGEPGRGKSMVAQYLLVQEALTGRNCLFIDLEKEFTQFRERIRALGATKETAARIGYWRVTRGLTDRSTARVLEFVRQWGVEVVVIDSVGRAVSRVGLNENDNNDVRRWYDNFIDPLVRVGCTPVMIDHYKKPQEAGGFKGSPSPGSRFAKGAGAKLDVITGAAYGIEFSQPFSATKAGKAHIVTAKDNNGWRYEGERAADVFVEPQNGGAIIGMSLRTPDVPSVSGGGVPRRTWYMEKVSQAVELNDGVNMSGLIKQVREVKHGASDKYVRDAARVLAEEGWLAETDHGVGKSKTFRLVKPYRQVNDPKSTDFVDKGTELADPGYF